MADFGDIISNWEEIGVFDFVLPFLLIFTLTFAVLQKSQLFGKNMKNLNVVVSVVIALLFIRNQYLVGLVNRFLPNVSMFLIIILMFLLFIGLFAGENKTWKGGILGVAFFVSIIFIIWALASDRLGENIADFPDWLANWDEQTKATVLFVAVFVIIIYFVTREPKENKEGFLKKLGDELSGG